MFVSFSFVLNLFVLLIILIITFVSAAHRGREKRGRERKKMKFSEPGSREDLRAKWSGENVIKINCGNF